VLDELSSGTDVDMPRLIVDVFSMTVEPTGCSFHHKKWTPPEPDLDLVNQI